MMRAMTLWRGGAASASAARCLRAGAAAVAAPAASASQVIAGRGVTYFDGRVRCPFAGLGARGDQASNRLALDDGESRVDDRSGTRHRITVVNTHPYPSRQIIADLTFLGTAKAESGARVPLAVHLKIEKKKAKISIDLHPHWTARGKLTAPELEPFEVVYNDGATEKVVATGDALLRAATETKLSYSDRRRADRGEGQPRGAPVVSPTGARWPTCRSASAPAPSIRC